MHLASTSQRKAAQTDDILGQDRKPVSEAKQFQHENIAAFRFGEDRLDAFLFEVLHAEKAYDGTY